MSDNSQKTFDAKALAEAVEGVNKAFEELKKSNDERLKEIEAKGAADPVLTEKIEKIEAELTAKQKILDEFQLALKRRERAATDDNGNAVDLDKKAQDWARIVTGDRRLEYTDADMQGYIKAFDMFIRKGEEKMGGTEEMKALSVGSDPDGGYVVHPDMSGRIVQKVFETSPMRAYASIQTISTDELTGLFDLDEAGGGWVSEKGARTETSTPQLKEYRIPVHELSALPYATQKLLDDASINMEAWLQAKVADKFARIENAAFVTGNGVGKPRGFLSYADGTTLPGQIERFNSGANGAFVAAPNGGDVLVDALYGLKQEYRNNAVWFMNRSVLKAVRKLKDSDGAYLWSPGIAAGQPASLLGYPVASFEDMPNLEAGSLSIAVGDMRAAYQIVDRQGVRVLRDPYSAKPYVQFYVLKRTGGDVVNFEALKLIEFSAS